MGLFELILRVLLPPVALHFRVLYSSQLVLNGRAEPLSFFSFFFFHLDKVQCSLVVFIIIFLFRQTEGRKL